MNLTVSVNVRRYVGLVLMIHRVWLAALMVMVWTKHEKTGNQKEVEREESERGQSKHCRVARDCAQPPSPVIVVGAQSQSYLSLYQLCITVGLNEDMFTLFFEYIRSNVNM